MAGTGAGSFASQQSGPGAWTPGVFNVLLIACFVCLFVCLFAPCVHTFTHAGACSVGRRYVTATKSCRDIWRDVTSPLYTVAAR